MPAFPARGARLPRGRAPRSSRLARCLFVSPRLPSSRQMAGGRKLDALLGSRARRRGGGATRPAAPVPAPPPPAGAGAVGDLLISHQRKELDASKALFTAAPELIYKRICARFAVPHPSARGAARKAQTRQCLAARGLFIASGREPDRPGDRTNSLRPDPFPASPAPMPPPPQGSADRLGAEGERSGCPAGLHPTPPRSDPGVEAEGK